LSETPSAVTIDGSLFLRAKVRERKEGVIDQYREDRMFSSRHAYLYPDGRLVVDHTDLVNPDRGKIQAAIHFVADHPMGRALGTVAGITIFRRLVK
jgi:hypothetical protein